MKKIVSIMVLLVVCLTTVMAQVTTSGISGKVVADGAEVIGATVTAVHDPSGSRYMAVTNEKGRYSIQGMRVGGPYTITISYLGYKDEVLVNVQLALGESSTFNVKLKEDSHQLGEVVVTGARSNNGMGASSNFKRSQIDNAPTVDRSVYDVAKLSPLIAENKGGGLSVAGANNRYNSFQIDGMVSNDVFGLAGTGTNGGQTAANPISMDAIQELQVVVSPFDVRQSGFTGGAINAITKSGTNAFKGSAYGYYTNQDLYGTWNQLYNKKDRLTKQDTQTYGFTLGGPIIKDKLFFFVNLEYLKNSYPSSYYPSDGYFLTPEVAQQIVDKYERVTGIRDNFGSRKIEKQGLSLLGRIDWNINTNNKLSFRYQFNDSYKDSYGSGSYTYYFANSAYRIKNKTNSFVAELNSHLSNSLYNELRAGATFVRDNREVPYGGPTIYINGSNKINIGTDYSSGANYLKQDIWTLEDNLSIYAGNHTISVGTHNELYKFENLFIQAAYGEYVYASVEDFLNDKASQFVYNYTDKALTGSTRWAAPFKAGQLGFYAQDKWDINTRLQLTYGLRIDIPLYLCTPSTNDEFNSSSYASDEVRTGQKPKSSVMFSPRVGFRWFATKDHRTILRGGVGVFSGRAPFVWLSNIWTNTGVEMKGAQIRSNVPSFEKYGADVERLMQENQSTATKPTINTVARDFKFPQVLRANLALEHTFPGDVKMTLEGLYSKDLNNVWFENLALTPSAKVYAITGSENSATTYFSSDNTSYSAIYHLKNSNKGYSYSVSAKLEKSFNFGLDVMASYTFGHSYSVNDGTSSVAASNWGNCYSVDPTKAVLSHSMFDKPHKVLVNVSYNSPRYAGNRLQTHVGLTYNGFSGQRYSLTYSDNSASYNGDWRTGNSLIYIPTATELDKMNFADITSNGKVTSTAAEQRAAFGQWIEDDSYAHSHRGQYAERNSNLAKWENHVDLHIAEDFYYLNKRGSKISLTFDIINFTNMLNKKWGTVYADSWSVNILKVTETKKGADGNYSATYQFLGNQVNESPVSSRWHAQVGLRVTF